MFSRLWDLGFVVRAAPGSEVRGWDTDPGDAGRARSAAPHAQGGLHILTCPPDDIRDMNVDPTTVGGEIVSRL